MRGLMKPVVLLIVSGILVGCASGPTMTAAQRAARHAKSVGNAGLQYYWKCDELSQLLDDGEKVARTYVIDENLYCLTNMNRLMAIDAARGVLRWSRWVHVAKPGKEVFDPVHVKTEKITYTPPTRKEVLEGKVEKGRKVKAFDAVIISTRVNALLIDRTSGQVLRDIRFNFTAAASATPGSPTARIACFRSSARRPSRPDRIRRRTSRIASGWSFTPSQTTSRFSASCSPCSACARSSSCRLWLIPSFFS